jgi:hypothetical protein
VGEPKKTDSTALQSFNNNDYAKEDAKKYA